MTIDLRALAQGLEPEKTVLFFGAGSSIPSGAPSVGDLSAAICKRFSINNTTLSLAEVSMLAEIRANRRDLIAFIRPYFSRMKVTGGLANLPLYSWKSLYTTNYDELIEQAFFHADTDIATYTTNFDFSQEAGPQSTKLFKIHGTIGKDVVDGHHSRIILTQSDYDKAGEYRDFIYDRFASDLAGSHLLIIGYSLSDPDIKSIVDRTLGLQAKLGGSGGFVTLLMYERDLERASLFENRGVRVVFGGVDDFFATLAELKPEAERDSEVCATPLDAHPKLRAITVDVEHAREALPPNFGRMFTGSPATYADIAAEFTFERIAAEKVAASLVAGLVRVPVLLGASGVGKTTAARQVGTKMRREGWLVWEHRGDFDLAVADWFSLATQLDLLEQSSLLIIDDAHFQISRVNELIERMEAADLTRLRLLIISSKHQWGPRYKSPVLNRVSRVFPINRLTETEIDRLLRLVDRNDVIRPLVEHTFSGYSTQERRRRLLERCKADMFVCLKNIFATEKFDDIILREFSDLDPKFREVYRVVSAMEYSGIRVHRQLIVRLLGVPADQVGDLLRHLEEIVYEYDIDVRESIYGWRVRHAVIAGIIVKYKFYEREKIIALFDQVISSISPAYEIELRTIREICNVETGIPSIPDKKRQNTLLRKMISVAPGERVPRHRLIRNLIDLNEFDQAETEIRLFEKDLGRDGPLARYQVDLLVARARDTPGLLEDDRTAILLNARDLATAYVDRYQHNRTVHGAYIELGIEWFKLTRDRSVFDEAIAILKAAEAKYGDPEMTVMIRRYERRELEREMM